MHFVRMLAGCSWQQGRRRRSPGGFHGDAERAHHQVAAQRHEQVGRKSMPQPNQGKPAPSAPTSQPIMDKSGAKSDAHIMTGVHVKGVKGTGTK